MPIELTKNGLYMSYLGSILFSKQNEKQSNILKESNFSHFFFTKKLKLKFWNISWQRFGTSPVGISWDRTHDPTQSHLFDIPSPDQPPVSF